MAKAKKYVYISNADLRKKSICDYWITGYYTFGSGQTVVNFEFRTEETRDATVPRFSKKSFRTPGTQVFEKYPSISKLWSPSKIVLHLAENKLFVKSVVLDKPMSREEREEQNLVDASRLTNSYEFKVWHEKIRKLIDQIKNDLPDFQTDSIRTESIKLIKGTIEYIQKKYKWNAADLKEIVDESAEEFLVSDVMKS